MKPKKTEVKTISIRDMPRDTWDQVRLEAIKNRETVAQALTRIITTYFQAIQ